MVSEAPRSTLALYLLLGYTLLIVYASLSPFTGWRDPGTAAFAFLTEPLPRYVSQFDLAINVLAYLPVGFLAALAVSPLGRPRLAAICGTVTGIALSLAMELAQGYLPGRICNVLDLLAHACGSLDGALVFVRAGPLRIIRDRFVAWRERRFRPGHLMDVGITLIALWFFSQLDPSLPLLGIVFFSDGVQAQLAGMSASSASRVLGPVSVALNFMGVGLTLMLIMRSSRAALVAVAALVCIAVLIKLVAATLLLRAEAAFLWVSKEVAVAIALGAIAVMVCAALPRSWVRVVCALALLGTIALGLLKPEDASSFLSLRLFRWNYLQLLHYTGLAAAVAEVWPYAALVFLYLSRRQERQLLPGAAPRTALDSPRS